MGQKTRTRVSKLGDMVKNELEDNCIEASVLMDFHLGFALQNKTLMSAKSNLSDGKGYRIKH